MGTEVSAREEKKVKKATKLVKGSFKGSDSRSSALTFLSRPSVASSIATVPET